ncbi:MAG: molybdenum cofactor guanylyltransferase MobA [Candidatus Marinarcus sp.]|uniref:molybdenum cofactor guanylyltransferase MobA n=1 Tax=Candidatus Marinarcus sp. TaxID=3100987 RepID=UPI003B009C25
MKKDSAQLLFNTIPIVILCGGKSSRMKEDKVLLPFGNDTTLIEFQYKKYQKIFKNVYISSKNHTFNFMYKRSNNIIYDYTSAISSPLIALKTILEKIETPKAVIIPVDTPFISSQTLKTLIEESENYDITVARSKSGTHNLCGVFSKSVLEDLDKMIDLNIHKIAYLLKQSNTKEIFFENEDEFLNMNTPTDYEKALEKINFFRQ